MQLTQSQPVGILNNQRVHIGDIDAGLNNGGADQHLYLTVGHLLHNMAQLPLAHFSVGDGDGRILSQQLPQPSGGVFDVLHTVVKVIHLTAPVQLPADGLSHHAPVMLQHIGLYRLAVLGRFLDGAHVTDAAEGHVQRAGNGSSRQRQRIHLLCPLPQLLFMGHAEALLLIDHQQAQILERHILAQQLMGTDQQIHPARLHPLQHILDLLGGTEPGQHLHRDREGAEPVLGRDIVLLGQHGGGHQNGRLLAVQNTLHHSPQGNLRLAVSHIAAQQPVHGDGFFHIALDLLNGPQLVSRLLIVKGVLKFPLPRAVGRKGKARLPLPLGIQPDQPRRQLLGGGFGPVGGLGPLGAAQFVELGGFFSLVAGADIFTHQIQRRGRYIEAVAAGVGDLDIVLLHPVHRQAQHLHEAADAVVGMHHQIAGRQVRIGLQLLPAAVLDPAGFTVPAADALRQLSLRQHRQFQRRPFASGAERPQHNGRLSLFRQGLSGQRQRRRDMPFLQQPLHIAGADLAAAQHDHPIAGGQIMLHIACRRLQ